MSDERGPMGTVADLAVFAPLGLILERRRVVAELADRGRRQIAFARMLGQTAFTVTIEDLRRSFRDPAGAETDPSTGLPELVVADRVAASVDSEATANAVTGPDDVATGPPSETLAIVDYDSLAAKQVVRRLSGLEPDELEDVRRYEASHRGRRTILGRIDQLQA
ncbi:MAG: hypothetical protein RIE08_11320 [Acidimicrobiales bacterium]